MRDGQPDSCVVVGNDRGKRSIRKATVDEDNRQARGRDVTEQTCLHERGGRDEPVDMACLQRLEDEPLPGRVVISVRQEKRVSVRLKAVFDPPNDRREAEIRDVGDHDADALRAARAHRPGDLVRSVAERRRRLEHATSRLLIDEEARLGIQSAGNSRFVNLRQTGDIPRGDHELAYQALRLTGRPPPS